MALWFREELDGIILFVRLTPRSAKDVIKGIKAAESGRYHLQARVRAVPEDGKANLALVRLLSKWLDVAVRDMTIVSGATSRLKHIKISGDAEELALKLAALAPPET
ncbi:DUF167 family protein [Phyllobacterium endophyticum]|uniref:DUF167 family protein n=1 Tax=Phyllobacterium endophyticum TaxID=1149773 RepID=UPI0011CB0A0C|nr:DUF167 family protein [Phyllobacterium endophyticum]TXR50346.1 hypothetical protein FVA77_05915 [Phyllobacterium endophyticum]